MSLYRRNTGRSGERIAERYLISKGFRILKRNYRTPFGEIDIVAKHGEYIVFLEVKTRTSAKAGSPLSAITRTKQQHMIRNSQYYLLRCNLADKPCRIDVVSVELDRDRNLQILKHVKNAFGIEAIERRYRYK
jgi:putative endonuclease